MELAIILVMLLIVTGIAAIKLSDQGLSFPFKRKTNLFSPVERSFLDLIEQGCGQQYRVVCRVRLTDIIGLRQSTDKKTAKSAMLRASGRHLDFVLCSKEDMSPVVAIDLVHKQGKENHKGQRDWFVSGALDAARIPHLRIKVKSGYSPQEIRDCVEAKLAPLRRKEPKPLIQGSTNPDNPNLNRPTRPLRSSRPVAA